MEFVIASVVVANVLMGCRLLDAMREAAGLKMREMDLRVENAELLKTIRKYQAFRESILEADDDLNK